MSIRTFIDSILDARLIYKSENCTSCIFHGKKPKKISKVGFKPARVRLFDAGLCTDQMITNGIPNAKLYLQIFWLSENIQSTFVPFTETSNLIRIRNPRFCLLISDAAIDFDVALSANSETECQRWISALLNSLYLIPRPFRHSLCLSNYLFSIIDINRAAKRCNLSAFEYWAVIDKDNGLTLFPASVKPCSTMRDTAAVSFPLERIRDVKLIETCNSVDVGKLLEIDILKELDDKKRSDLRPPISHLKLKRKFSFLTTMSKRWRSKSPKKLLGDNENKSLTSAATLGFHTLSVFCPDAQKFVEEWKYGQKMNKKDKNSTPCQMNGSRLSSSSNQSGSSQSNLSALNVLLRRSLPSLNNVNSISGKAPTNQKHQPPPRLPSRRELEQMENDRLIERQRQLHRLTPPTLNDEKLKQNSSYCERVSSPSSSNTFQYKILPNEVIPIRQFRVPPDPISAPPLPPKKDTPNRKLEIPTHYKLLTDYNSQEYDYSFRNSPAPPVPPRPIGQDVGHGYKLLNPDLNDPYIFTVLANEKKKGAALYNILPEPAPVGFAKNSHVYGVIRRSLETEV